MFSFYDDNNNFPFPKPYGTFKLLIKQCCKGQLTSKQRLHKTDGTKLPASSKLDADVFLWRKERKKNNKVYFVLVEGGTA